MRKINFTAAQDVRRLSASAMHTRSWIPATQFATPALDPAHWSQRKSQANFWRLLEQIERLKTVH